MHEAQERVFHEASTRKSGKPAGFVDGQNMGVFKQHFEVLRGVWFHPGWAVPDERLARRKRFASGGCVAIQGDFAVVQLFRQPCGVEWG